MCGIVGIVGADDVFTKIYRAAGKIQHRGSDGVGVVFSDGLHFLEPAPHRTLGEVAESFESLGEKKTEKVFLGLLHIRYGTSGNRKNLANTQPFVVQSPYHGTFCLAHNGDTRDEETETLRDGLRVIYGVQCTSDSDSEVLAQLIAHYKNPTLPGAVAWALKNIKSAYALVLATPNSLIATRDPWGFRPLSIGKIESGGYIVASETCTFEIVGAKHVADIAPGDVVVIDKHGYHVAELQNPLPCFAQCVFEPVYFSYPTSHVFGKSVSMFRHRLGERLAEEYMTGKESLSRETLIIPVPNSGYHYAEGFSHKLWHPLTFAISRTKGSARTFIGSDSKNRIVKVLLKLNIDSDRIRGKDCILVDDSLIRGNTMRAIVALLRKHGARRITVLLGFPPVLNPCFYGIDFKTESELIARKHACDIAAICADVGADELSYISLEGFYEVVKSVYGNTRDFCFACLNGEYAL